MTTSEWSQEWSSYTGLTVYNDFECYIDKHSVHWGIPPPSLKNTITLFWHTPLKSALSKTPFLGNSPLYIVSDFLVNTYDIKISYP